MERIIQFYFATTTHKVQTKCVVFRQRMILFKVCGHTCRKIGKMFPQDMLVLPLEYATSIRVGFCLMVEKSLQACPFDCFFSPSSGIFICRMKNCINDVLFRTVQLVLISVHLLSVIIKVANTHQAIVSFFEIYLISNSDSFEGMNQLGITFF